MVHLRIVAPPSLAGPVLDLLETSPAVGFAAAYGDWSELGGALLQLLINLACIVIAGVATLSVQRALFARREARTERVSRGWRRSGG